MKNTEKFMKGNKFRQLHRKTTGTAYFNLPFLKIPHPFYYAIHTSLLLISFSSQCELPLTHLFGLDPLWLTTKQRSKPLNPQRYQLSYPLSFNISDESDRLTHRSGMNTTALSVAGRQEGGGHSFQHTLGLLLAAITFCGQVYPKYINNDANSSFLSSSQKKLKYFYY